MSGKTGAGVNLKIVKYFHIPGLGDHELKSNIEIQSMYFLLNWDALNKLVFVRLILIFD